jgi:hypothetical protein
MTAKTPRLPDQLPGAARLKHALAALLEAGHAPAARAALEAAADAASAAVTEALVTRRLPLPAMVPAVVSAGPRDFGGMDRYRQRVLDVVAPLFEVSPAEADALLDDSGAALEAALSEARAPVTRHTRDSRSVGELRDARRMAAAAPRS